MLKKQQQMAGKLEYTALANRYTARFPVATHVSIQVNFWVIANLLLVSIMHLQSQMMSQAYHLQSAVRLGPMLLIAAILGVLYGLCLGLIGYYLDKKLLRKLALGKIILFKALASLAVLILILVLIRYVLFHPLISPPLFLDQVTLSDRSWDYLFYLLLVYYFFMTLVNNFINQINKKFGPGVLLPLLLGRYQNPREEERIFMFMDLKSSTTVAEQLGHLKYSAFIRDCFSDINEVLFPFRAQVYQYVGDEMVVMWPTTEGLDEQRCVRFYFACRSKFNERASHYLANYGLVPTFKAGVHLGIVTAVEIGEIKKDIAYHGDTLNTAARIQSVCNDFGQDFLASDYLIQKTGINSRMKVTPLGMIQLRGKTEKVGLVSVEWMEEN